MSALVSALGFVLMAIGTGSGAQLPLATVVLCALDRMFHREPEHPTNGLSVFTPNAA